MRRLFLVVFLLSGVTPRGDMAQRKPEPEAEPENTPEPHAPKHGETWEDVKFDRFLKDNFHALEAWALALNDKLSFHDYQELVDKRGCDPRTAVQILL